MANAVKAAKAPGAYMAHAERAERTGRVRVDVYLSASAAEKLDRLAASTASKTRTEALEKLLNAARIRGVV